MESKLRKIATEQAPKAIGPYSQAITDGNYLFVSGQLPIDPTTGKLIEGDIKVLTNRVLDNIEAILLSGGSDFKHVVRVDIFLKDLSSFKSVNEEYSKRFSLDLPPARQTVGVSQLPLDSPIEISCIALIKNKP